MIRIQQLTLQTEHTRGELEARIRRELRIGPGESISWEIRRRSLDARKKPKLMFSYTIDVSASARLERKICDRADGRRVSLVKEQVYSFPEAGNHILNHPPVIIGTGPAGLFCGLMLARYGYQPILLEQGMDVDRRCRDVETFWKSGQLHPYSNVQFGEGGAGTFSDGKLNTLVRDSEGRNREVLRLFVEAGADPSILYDSKPHIGTDKLVEIVKTIRKQIEACGGVVRFGAKVTGFVREQNKITGVIINETEQLPCEAAVLAIGHSARDTFQTLYEQNLQMEAKEFAVGLRVEHSQEAINLSQYGKADPGSLGAASYKVTAKAADGRGVYSFCMCPGGYVVNASSEEGHLAINGMSYSGRSGTHANSAIVVTVKKSDFSSDHPLAGIAFQRQIEEAAWQAGNGKIPVQRLGDFRDVFTRRTNSDVRVSRTGDCNISCKRAESSDITAAGKAGSLTPSVKGAYVAADLTQILPEKITTAFLEGMEQFSRMIKGFADRDTLLSAVESRTSSPVRILRDASFQSSLRGLYPCGEGAGYAGGITSAAMDGMRTAEAIRTCYRPLAEKKERNIEA